jgi:peptidyl-prolyl cis-trans isomerase SurA
MKSKTIAIGAALALSAFGAPSAQGGATIINRIIARVNNEIITQRQFQREQQKLRGSLAQQYSGAELETQYREQQANLLRNLIDEDLMVEKAKDLDLNVETDVIKRLDQIRQANNLGSLQDLEKEVESQGIIWEDFQDQIRRQLLMQQVIEHEVGSRLTTSREEARKYFDAHRQDFASPAGVSLGQIMISTDKHKPEEVEKRAQAALAELKNGAKWEDVVKKYSDNADAGPRGDIGFFKEGTLAANVASAVAKLDVGENTGVISTQYGDLILRVLDRRSAGEPKFEEVEQRVDETLYNQKIQGQLRNYLGELRRESYIYVAPGYVDSGAVKSDNAEAAELNE